MTWNNRFLDTLPPSDVERLGPHLEKVTYSAGECLLTDDDHVRVAWFPIDCIICVVICMLDGSTIQSRTIGCEGAFGTLPALGNVRSRETVEIQLSGKAWRINIAALEAVASASPSLRRHIVAYAYDTLVQVTQDAACNTLHNVRQRLCRWLLTTADRVGSESVPLTQDHLAGMLGVQRTTITLKARELQAQGIIQYARGSIQLIDREKLRFHACECYLDKTSPSRAEPLEGLSAEL